MSTSATGVLTIVQAFERAAKILSREAEPVHAAVQLHDHRDPLRKRAFSSMASCSG